MLAGLIDRQKFPVLSPKGKNQLQQERQLIETLQEKVKENNYFQKLTNKQQKKLINNGEWKLQSWKDIALSAGLNESHAQAFYNYLCGYAHSGSLSILQLRQARTKASQKALCAATINILVIASSYMIRSYCLMFPKADKAIQKNKDDVEFIEKWISIGSASLEDVKIDWERETLES